MNNMSIWKKTESKEFIATENAINLAIAKFIHSDPILPEKAQNELLGEICIIIYKHILTKEERIFLFDKYLSSTKTETPIETIKSIFK